MPPVCGFVVTQSRYGVSAPAPDAEAGPPASRAQPPTSATSAVLRDSRRRRSERGRGKRSGGTDVMVPLGQNRGHPVEPVCTGFTGATTEDLEMIAVILVS